MFSLLTHTHHIDTKLQFRLRLYIVLALIILGIVTYEVTAGFINIVLAEVFFGLGILIGIIASRTHHISWNDEAQKVMAQLDTFGILILISYWSFSFVRSRLIEHFVHGQTVAAASFCIAAGVMIGRILGIRKKVLNVLKKQELF